MVQQYSPDPLPDKTSRAQEENDVEARFVCHRSVCGESSLTSRAPTNSPPTSATVRLGLLANLATRSRRSGISDEGSATRLSTETTLSEPENRLVEKPEQGLLVVDRARSK